MGYSQEYKGGKKTKVSKRKKAKATKRVDKQQNKRLAALERANKAEMGWIDSEYREATCSRVPQEISRGVQNTVTNDSEFFVMAQGTDLSDKDHKRIGLSINAQQIQARVRFACRGDGAGFPPVNGSKVGKNSIRLLGIVYETLADYNIGLAEVLQNSADLNTHPSRVIDSYFKKQSTTKWHKWCDHKVDIPYSVQTKVFNLNYKIPKKYQKMVYPIAESSPPDTNIFVLYAMTGIRDNAQNTTTVSATYRCLFAK